jgi:lipoate-protein ligase A
MTPTARVPEDGMWRLLPPVALDAATLLGRLQAVLESVGAGATPPTICFERWQAPTLILGAGQRSADADLAACRARGVTVVRRLAGGTAVYATPDYLSFAIVAPATHPLVGGGLLATYRRLGEAVVAACAALGLPTHQIGPDAARARPTPAALRPCCYGGFSPYEVLVGDRKLIGVAQVRRFGAVAYVGGLYRTLVPTEQSACLAGDAALRAERAAQLAASTIDLATLGRSGALEQFPAALVAALGACQGIVPTPGEFTDVERAGAARLTAERYARDEWTHRT